MIGSLFTLAGNALTAIGRALERPDFNDDAAADFLAGTGRMECDGPDAADLLAEAEAEYEVFEPLPPYTAPEYFSGTPVAFQHPDGSIRTDHPDAEPADIARAQRAVSAVLDFAETLTRPDLSVSDPRPETDTVLPDPDPASPGAGEDHPPDPKWSFTAPGNFTVETVPVVDRPTSVLLYEAAGALRVFGNQHEDIRPLIAELRDRAAQYAAIEN